jgi:hypothetical protein
MPIFDYTSRDYYSIKEDLLSRAAELPIGASWNTRSTSDFGVMLVDLWAYMGDVLHFYVDRAAAETFVSTATQRESLLAFSNLVDYEPIKMNAAKATVTLVSTAAWTGLVEIPAYTSFVAPAQNDNETTVYFVSTTSASMASSSTAVTIPLTEGIAVINESPTNTTSISANFSNGTSNQKFNLRYSNVLASSISVLVYEGALDVNGLPTAVSYRYVDRLIDVASYERVFSLATSADNISQIVFGNGINGKIPQSGAEIKVSYIRSSGSYGNIKANKITAFASNTPIGVKVDSSTAAVGGYDAESVLSMKANIPALLRTQDRAVSLQDFKDLSLRIPGVSKATASNAGSTVTLYAVPFQTDYLLPSFGSTISIPANIQTNAITYFEPKIMLGASATAASSVDLTSVYITANVVVKDGYVQRSVRDAVTAALDTIFEFDAVYFGQVLSLGEIYKLIMNVEGVDYVSISRFNTSSGVAIASGNKITAAPTSLLKKAVDYDLSGITGGVVGA